MEAQMNSESQMQGGSADAGNPIEPLEPGRPDIMPNPPLGDGGVPPNEGEIPLDPDDEAPVEEDMGDVEVNNSVSKENPPQG
jgi:hypothetical protein